MSDKLAWMATDEDGSTIEFLAEEPIQEEDSEYTYERKPEYDLYSSLGYVPSEVLIRDGWWLECWECGTRIDEDGSENPEYIDDEETPDEREYLDPVFENQMIFCCWGCQQSFHETRAQIKAQRIAARLFIEAQFPGALKLSIYATTNEATANFKFPGSVGRAEWDSKDPHHVTVLQVDAPVWRAWRRPIKHRLAKQAAIAYCDAQGWDFAKIGGELV
jgi:hypothetical protein